MKVVLLNQYYAPDEAATAQLLADVGEGLARAGHDVLAVCSRRSYADSARRYPRSEVRGGVRIRRVRGSGFGRGSQIGRLLDYLTFLSGAALILVFRGRADVIVSLSTPPMVAALGALVARLRRVRSVFWVMDVYPELAFELGILRPASLGGRLLGRLSRGTLRRSGRVVALDETMARRLRLAGARDVVVVQNWADGDAIRPIHREGHRLRMEWGWNEKFVVLYSGNMGLAHEFETVLAAVERLREDTGILFGFVGAGPRRKEVEERVRRSGLKNVDLRPYQPREGLSESLTAGDVHLITLRERMVGLVVPSKIYGILAAGRPTLYIGPPEGAVYEIIEQNGCGCSVRNGDIEGLVATIRDYAGNPARGAAEGASARRAFDSGYSRPRGVGSFVRLLEEEFGRSRRRA